MLNEYKNISDISADLSNEIYRAILDNASDHSATKLKKSDITGALYVENSFNINVNRYFKGLSELNVCYTLYYCRDAKAYNSLMYTIGSDANSYGDYDDKSIKIVSGFIDGEISTDFLQTIYHEVNHLYEYDNGRKKKIDLYSEAVKLAMDNDIDVMMTARALYYSFRHERDAFVHQFYGFLKQTNADLPFEDALSYSEYKNAKRCYDYVVNSQNNKAVIATINRLGYGKRDFIKRIKFGLNSLKRKMANAYLRFKYERFKTDEHSFRMALKRESERLDECEEYDTPIKWGIESVFEI